MKKLITLLAAAAVVLTGCTPAEEIKDIRLATHESFVITDEQVAEFESQTGYKLEVVRVGDAGELTNQLVLAKDAPFADIFYGVDNTMLHLIENNSVSENPVAINYGDVCFNYDIEWFTKTGLTPPTSWRELGDPKFKNLTVVTNPILSSPGLAFLATTFAAFDSNAETFAYWRSLRDNGVRISNGWSDAYFGDYTRYGGNRPIVLSYASSPAAEVLYNGEPGAAALLDECFRQTEFGGVIKKAKNPKGGQALLDYLLSESFQTGLPTNMYVYPIIETELPEAWSKFAIPARSTLGEKLDFEAGREQWLKDWSDVFDN